MHFKSSGVDDNGFPALPASVSTEAREYFRAQFSRARRDAMVLPHPDDLGAWTELNRRGLLERREYNDALKRRYEAELIEREIGGVRVVDIRPQGWVEDGKVLLYTHGGGFTGGAAADALDSTLPIATESRLRILSVDFPLAPHARHEAIADEVVAVVRALISQGHGLSDMAVYGESAGATIAAASVLRLRDRGHGLPAALVLWSPWTDLSCSGDSYVTLGHVEPFYRREGMLATAVACYAGTTNPSDPAVSVVNADFRRGFPPSLIQVGTRELLLSDSVRLYQALDDARQDVKLDVYDGMWHVFQFKPIDMPEAVLARRKTIAFLRRHLYA